jgi:putative transposase
MSSAVGALAQCDPSSKGSANRKKVKEKLARLPARIAAILSDALHQLTANLARQFHTLGIEDLNVRGMVQNLRLARTIAEMGFFEFRRQLESKATMHGRQVVAVDRIYGSSKMCSSAATRWNASRWLCASGYARIAARSMTAT